MATGTATISVRTKVDPIIGSTFAEQLGYLGRHILSYIAPVSVRADVTLSMGTDAGSELGSSTRTVTATLRRGRMVEGTARVN